MINQEFKTIDDLYTAFHDEQTCINHLQELRWNGFALSPFDSTSKVYQCKVNSYKCKNSGKYFNVKTGTIFHNSKIELQKWFAAIWLVTESRKGISSVALSKDLNITQKTAWYMIKRIKAYHHLEKDCKRNGKSALKNKTTVTDTIEEKLEMLEWLKQLQPKP